MASLVPAADFVAAKNETLLENRDSEFHCLVVILILEALMWERSHETVETVTCMQPG